MSKKLGGSWGDAFNHDAVLSGVVTLAHIVILFHPRTFESY
jgi:hypothetical protein